MPEVKAKRITLYQIVDCNITRDRQNNPISMTMYCVNAKYPDSAFRKKVFMPTTDFFAYFGEQPPMNKNGESTIVGAYIAIDEEYSLVDPDLVQDYLES